MQLDKFFFLCMQQIRDHRTDAERFAQDHRFAAAPLHRPHQSFSLSDPSR